MWYIYALIWLVGAIVTFFIVKSWKQSWVEKIYFCLIWPFMIPLYIIHLIHTKL